jgi:hypothetical protein
MQRQRRDPADGHARHLVLARTTAARAAEQRWQAAWCGDPELAAIHLDTARRLEAESVEHQLAASFLERAAAP